MKQWIFIAAATFGLSACKKVEGEGGTSTIKGKIYIHDYNSVGTLLAEYDGAKEDVFIIYGDEDLTYDDKMDASYDGSFEFKYLENGTYTIFAYEDCLECPSGEKEVKVTVKIDKKKSVIDLGQIILKK